MSLRTRFFLRIRGMMLANNKPTQPPALVLDFTTQTYSSNSNSRTFNQLIDFTRTSSATYVDATGKIVSTPASRNLLTFTQEFDNAVWMKDRITVTNNGATAPDGTLTAEIVIPTAVSGTHGFGTSPSVSLTSGVTYTASIYAKAAGYNFLRFLVYNGSANLNNYFNLSNGTTGTIAAGVTAAITSVGNGWYRCVCTFTAAVTATNSVFIVQPHVASADNTTTFTGDGTSGIFLWGAQLEAGSTATTYTRNNGGVYPPRFDYDPVTLAPKGLLVEEQRTNLLLRSEEFDNASWIKSSSTVTANATTSPDGTVDADKLVETTTTGIHAAAQAANTTASTTYTFSVYLKSAERSKCRLYLGNAAGSEAVAVDVDTTAGTVATVANTGTNWTNRATTISSAGNGWWRVVLSASNASLTSVTSLVYLANASGNIGYTGDGTSGLYIWGAQLEAGAFATSYIPTVASQVTRTADVATITGTNFSQWYNQSEGTFVAQAMQPAATGYNARVLSANNGTVSESIQLSITSAGTQGYAEVRDDSVAVMASVNGTVAVGSVFKIALGYKLNDCAVSTNGAAVASDTSVTLPSVDRLSIGTHAGGLSPLNGHICSIQYHNTRLSNAQLQALTS